MKQVSDVRKKPRVLFVAGLEASAGGATGGQRAAARLLFDSPIRDFVDFVPLSSTMETIPPPPVSRRLRNAVIRGARFSAAVRGTDAVLIFSSGGLSLAEKSSMAAIARAVGKGVVLRYSSGQIPEQVGSSRTLRAAMLMGIRSAHVLCTQGPSWNDFYGRFAGSRTKLVQIPNAVAIPPTVDRMRGEIRRLIFVGWLERSKGVYELLDAFGRCFSTHPGLELMFVGGGSEEHSLRRAVREQGLESSVRLLGWVDPADIYGLLSTADLFVLPTHHEGLPNALLEAMACGLPVITTPVGAIQSIVSHGVEGWLIAPRSSAELEQAIRAAIQDPVETRTRGLRARDRMIAGHSVERMWRSYFAALTTAIEMATERRLRKQSSLTNER